ENTFTATELAIFVKQAEQRIYNMVQLANLRRNQTGTITSGNKYLSAPDDYLSTYSLAVYTYASPTATGTSGAFTITVSSATDIAVGQVVTGSGIGTGAQVTIINGTTITLSVANSGVVSGTIIFQGDYLYLLDKDVNFIREVYPNPNSKAEPKYYAIFGPQSANVTELSFILGPTPDRTYKAELHYYYYPESIVTAGTSWLGDNFDSTLLYGSLVEAYTFMKGEQDMMALYDVKYKEAMALLKNLGDGKQRADTYRDGQVKVKVQ
ncbi:MAG: hypothetical protein EBU08_17900, partial [Micrococcales bacterium]|nr:hypothetical protein [Micrococcales bacterium]